VNFLSSFNNSYSIWVVLVACKLAQNPPLLTVLIPGILKLEIKDLTAIYLWLWYCGKRKQCSNTVSPCGGTLPERISTIVILTESSLSSTIWLWL
jgi:hypothetical protein